MGFSNVLDSSIINYSDEFEKNDVKLYNERIVDIIGKEITSGVDKPNAFYFDNFKVKKYNQAGCSYNPYILYDSKTQVCYATELVEITLESNLEEWFYESEEGKNIEDLPGSLSRIGMIIVKVPALNDNNFVFFCDSFDLNNGYDFNSFSTLDYWKRIIQDDTTIYFIKNLLKKKYHVLNYDIDRYYLARLQVAIGDTRNSENLIDLGEE